MSYTIMIIDDEQMILDMLRDQFEMEQYQVITAKSGETPHFWLASFNVM